MDLEEVIEGDVLVVRVKDRRLDARVAPALKSALAGVVGRGSEWIVLDLSAVEFVDSSALGAIVSGLKFLGHNGDLVIAGAREPVLALFRLTRMDKVFRIFATEAAAVGALTSRV